MNFLHPCFLWQGKLDTLQTDSLFSQPARFKWTVEVVMEQTGKMSSRKSAGPEGFIPAFKGNSRMR